MLTLNKKERASEKENLLNTDPHLTVMLLNDLKRTNHNRRPASVSELKQLERMNV